MIGILDNDFFNDSLGRSDLKLLSVRVFCRDFNDHECKQVDVNCFTGEVRLEDVGSQKCPSEKNHSVVLIFESACGNSFALCVNQEKYEVCVKRIDIPGFLL